MFSTLFVYNYNIPITEVTYLYTIKSVVASWEVTWINASIKYDFYSMIKYFTDVLEKKKIVGSLFIVNKYLCVCDVVLSYAVYCKNSHR